MKKVSDVIDLLLNQNLRIIILDEDGAQWGGWQLDEEYYENNCQDMVVEGIF